MAVLEVDRLSVSYGAIHALSDVSFRAEEGEVTAVLGANGAGKTTLLRAISGLVKCRGSVRYDGEHLENTPVERIVRRGIAHVPEGRSVIEEMTVEENLRLGALWRFHRRERAAVIDEIYELFPPLSERRRQHASTLSGGERQMLSIGRALVARPKALLLDEPSLGLAPIVTARLMKVLRDLTTDSKLIVVLVEQNARSALSISQRAVVMNLGRVVISDDAQTVAQDAELRHHYLGVLGAAVQFFVNITLGGIATGMIVASVALGLVLIFRSTNVVNFAQGAMAMMTTYIAYAIMHQGFDYWVTLLFALAVAMVFGALTQLVLIRPLQHRSPLNAVIVTFGFLILLEGIAGAVWGSTTRTYPAPFSEAGQQIGSFHIAFSPFDLYGVVAVLVVMVLMVILFRGTNLGLRMRAVAFAPEAARLLGVRVQPLLTLGWALATAIGVVGALLVVPTADLTPNFMDVILVYGFTAAVVGGLDSPVGALVGGLVTGLSLAWVGGYLGGSLEPIAALALVIVSLMVRPEGIFARPAPRRV